MSQPDRERAITTARGLFRLPEECVRDVADAMLEFAAEYLDTLSYTSPQGLQDACKELRSQKSKDSK